MENMNLKSNDYCLCTEIPLKTKRLNFRYTTHPWAREKDLLVKKS